MTDCLAVCVLSRAGSEVPLVCVLGDGHEDMHWDQAAGIAWFPWSAEDEARRE